MREKCLPRSNSTTCSTVQSDGDGYHLRPGLHGFANRLAAEFDYRLDQLAIAFLDDAFFLSRFNQGVDGFGRSFRFGLGVLAGERG